MRRTGGLQYLAFSFATGSPSRWLAAIHVSLALGQPWDAQSALALQPSICSALAHVDRSGCRPHAPPHVSLSLCPLYAKAFDTVLVAGANGARVVSATGDALLGASGANGSVVLEGGSAILGSASSVFFAASKEGLAYGGTCVKMVLQQRRRLLELADQKSVV